MHLRQYRSKLRTLWRWLIRLPLNYWRGSWVHKLVSVIVIIVAVIILFIAGVGEWYIHSEANTPLTYGVSFVPDYAASLGVNPQQNFAALLSIGVRQFRLTSYWSDIEPSPGQYNFSQLDWEFKMADAAHAKIILTVGLRQPRWPECHPPSWVNTAGPMSTWEPQLLAYMTKVIDRYKNNPALQAWQLENEYFLKGFGNCQNYSRSRLVSEYNLLKRLDPNHPIILGRSNNAVGFPVGAPTPDIYGVSVYQRVWDGNITHRYIEYPFPAWFYGFLAGIQEIFEGKNMIIDEMQAEPWPPNGQSITQVSLAVQNQTLNAARLKGRFAFGKATGMKDVIMWGAEYWYYRKVVLHDPSVWNVAKAEFAANHDRNGEYIFDLLKL